MPVFRIEKTTRYTVMSNHHLTNPALSLKAKGLLSYMLSLPSDWDYSVKGLARQSADGPSSVSTALGELEEHHYLLRRKLRDSRGRIRDYEYLVYEQPYEGTKADQLAALPESDFPNLEKPDAEKQVQLNTKRQSTKEQSTIYLPLGDEKDQEEEEERFREQLEYDILERRYDPSLLGDLLANIVQMYCCRQDYQKVGRQLQSTAAVRRQLDRLTSQHVEYIIDCLQNNRTDVQNIRQYLRATILNAPTTCESYYAAKAGSAMVANGRKPLWKGAV